MPTQKKRRRRSPNRADEIDRAFEALMESIDDLRVGREEVKVMVLLLRRIVTGTNRNLTPEEIAEGDGVLEGIYDPDRVDAMIKLGYVGFSRRRGAHAKVPPPQIQVEDDSWASSEDVVRAEDGVAMGSFLLTSYLYEDHEEQASSFAQCATMLWMISQIGLRLDNWDSWEGLVTAMKDAGLELGAMSVAALADKRYLALDDEGRPQFNPEKIEEMLAAADPQLEGGDPVPERDSNVPKGTVLRFPK